MLNSSFDQGFETSVTASANLGVVSAEASVGASASGGLESETEHEIAQEIASASESNQELVYEIECNPPEGKRRAGLWQWVISTEDYSVAAFTPHTVCRTGDLAFKAPECAFHLCANYDCSECKGASTPAVDEDA